MRRRTTAAAVLLAVVLAACVGPADRTLTVDATPAPKDDVLVVWLPGPDALHPHDASPHLTAALFSPLVLTDDDDHRAEWGDDAPGALLQSISSTDLRRWELTLKPGWRWHDDTAVTAADVERGWRAAIDAGLPLTSTITDVRATGTTTLAVALAAPYGQFPHLLAHETFLPLPPIAVNSPARFAASPVGTGPYRIAGRSGGAYLLEVVADHPAPGAVPDIAVHLTGKPSPATDLLIGGDGQALPELTGPMDVTRLPGRQLAYLAFPLTEDAYRDPDVRHALSLAIDRPTLARDVLAGSVLPADRLVGPAFARADVGDCDACAHDPSAARDLWPGDLDEPVTIWFAADAAHEPVIDAVADAWASELGITNLQLASLPAADLLTRLVDNDVSGPFRLSWHADVSVPSRVLEPLFGPRGVANDSRYRSGEVAEQLRRAGLAADPDEALQAYAAAEAAVLADLPMIPLWFSTVPVAADPALEGVALDGEGRLRWDLLRR